MTEETLAAIAKAAMRYNGAGQDTVLSLVVEIRDLRNILREARAHIGWAPTIAAGCALQKELIDRIDVVLAADERIP